MPTLEKRLTRATVSEYTSRCFLCHSRKATSASLLVNPSREFSAPSLKYAVPLHVWKYHDLPRDPESPEKGNSHEMFCPVHAAGMQSTFHRYQIKYASCCVCYFSYSVTHEPIGLLFAKLPVTDRAQIAFQRIFQRPGTRLKIQCILKTGIPQTGNYITP